MANKKKLKQKSNKKKHISVAYFLSQSPKCPLFQQIFGHIHCPSKEQEDENIWRKKISFFVEEEKNEEGIGGKEEREIYGSRERLTTDQTGDKRAI